MIKPAVYPACTKPLASYILQHFDCPAFAQSKIPSQTCVCLFLPLSRLYAGVHFNNTLFCSAVFANYPHNHTVQLQQQQQHQWPSCSSTKFSVVQFRWRLSKSPLLLHSAGDPPRKNAFRANICKPPGPSTTIFCVPSPARASFIIRPNEKPLEGGNITSGNAGGAKRAGSDKRGRPRRAVCTN